MSEWSGSVCRGNISKPTGFAAIAYIDTLTQMQAIKIFLFFSHVIITLSINKKITVVACSHAGDGLPLLRHANSGKVKTL